MTLTNLKQSMRLARAGFKMAWSAIAWSKPGMKVVEPEVNRVATVDPTPHPPHPPHRRCYILIALAHACLAALAALEPVPLIAASEALIAVTYLYLASRPGA